MRIFDGKVYRDMTPEEIATMETEARKADLMERSRPLTAEEVSQMLLTQQVNALEVDDNTALRMTEFYPKWTEGIAYAVGFKVRHCGRLWKCRQAHTAQVGWDPEAVGSLWEQVCERHDGSLDDPIPYSGGMALEEGKYYHQEYEVYRCVRSTGSPVYHALAELVGLYVEAV